MNPILVYLSFSFYFIAGILYLLQLIFTRLALTKQAFRLTILGFILQSVFLGLYFYQRGYPYLVNSSSSYLFTAWVAALVFMLLNLKQKLQLLGILVLPLITTFYLLSYFSSESYVSESLLLKNPWASIHILFNFLALAIFSISFVLGIMFIIEEFQLKYKVLPKLFLKFPSLETLEKDHARASLLGFILLTLGIISGVFWAKSATGFFFFEDARQLGTLGAWLIYGLFIQGRWAAGWRGRRSVILSMIGFGVILFTFIGVQHR